MQEVFSAECSSCVAARATLILQHERVLGAQAQEAAQQPASQSNSTAEPHLVPSLAQGSSALSSPAQPPPSCPGGTAPQQSPGPRGAPAAPTAQLRAGPPARTLAQGLPSLSPSARQGHGSRAAGTAGPHSNERRGRCLPAQPSIALRVAGLGKREPPKGHDSPVTKEVGVGHEDLCDFGVTVQTLPAHLVKLCLEDADPPQPCWPCPIPAGPRDQQLPRATIKERSQGCGIPHVLAREGARVCASAVQGRRHLCQAMH